MKNKKPSALGKGIGALIPDNVLQGSGVSGKADADQLRDSIARIDISLIRPNPFQPRTDFDPVALEELKESIREKGVIQPVTVRPVEDGGFELIAGERRFRACSDLNLETIPAFVVPIETDAEMLELALIENVQRDNLNPIEVAKGYRRLIDECQLTQEQVAQKVGKDRVTVTNFLRLLRLPDEVLNATRRKELSMGHARALLGIREEAKILATYEAVVEHELSVRLTEKLAKLVEGGMLVSVAVDSLRAKKSAPEPKSGPKKQPPKRKIPEPEDSEFSSMLGEIESQLRTILATKVKLKSKPDGAGTVEIDYYSNEELERLLDLFAVIEREQMG